MPATLKIVPWSDPLIDCVGYDPRSRYVETFWLPTLGPTSVLLLRHLAARFEHHPEGIDLPVAATSQALGLGSGDGNSSPIVRTLNRLATFDLACDDGRGTHAVRRHIPPVNPRHIRRLPQAIQEEHGDWAEALDVLEVARRRSRRLALALLEQGEEPDRLEWAIGAAGFHPSVAYESARWAIERHEQARAAAGGEAA